MNIDAKVRNCIVFLLALVVAVSAVYAFSNMGEVTGSFSLVNDPPNAPILFNPGDTHYLSQNFSWTSGGDTNGDDVNFTLCISNTTAYACNVVHVALTRTDYVMSASVSDPWEYAEFGLTNKTYYVNITPYDGNSNGTQGYFVFGLYDYQPNVSDETTDAAATCDKDIGEYINFSAYFVDTDTSDNHSFRVCKTNSINDNGECETGQEWCNSTINFLDVNSPFNCSELLDPGEESASSYDAYYFVCDCPQNGTGKCPGQCSNATSNQHTFYVNHAPSATPTITPATWARSTETLTCNVGFSDSDTEGAMNSEGTHTYKWFKRSPGETDLVMIAGQTASTLDPSNFAANDNVTCEATPVDSCSFAGTAVNASLVAINNSEPNKVASVQIQDGASNWDTKTVPDTHDLTVSIRFTTSDNDSSTEGDSVRTHICLSAFAANRDANTCDVNYTIMEYAAVGVTTQSDIDGLYYNGTNVSFYVRLITEDNSSGTMGRNSSAYDFSFVLNNSIPVAGSFNTTATHDPTPELSWNVTDADDGSDGYWPADSLVNYIRLGNNTSIDVYSTSDSADNNSYTSDLIPWADPGSEFSNRTVNVSIIVFDGHINSTNLNTSFTLSDYLPSINELKMIDTGAYGGGCDTEGICLLNPQEGVNTTVNALLNITDIDNDCDETVHDGYLILCLNFTDNQNCDDNNNANYTFELDNVFSEQGYCLLNFTSVQDNNTPEFFRLPGHYKLHINISSQAGERLADTLSNQTWEYGTLKAVNYSSSVALGGASISLGQWSSGTNEYLLTNWGNDVMALVWNSSDPTSGADTWDLNASDFMIDDDNDYSSDAGSEPFVYLNGTDRYFNYSTGLEVCLEYNCNDADTNETLPTYYHIAPPTGLLAGTYTNTITLTLESK